MKRKLLYNTTHMNRHMPAKESNRLMSSIAMAVKVTSIIVVSRHNKNNNVLKSMSMRHFCVDEAIDYFTKNGMKRYDVNIMFDLLNKIKADGDKYGDSIPETSDVYRIERAPVVQVKNPIDRDAQIARRIKRQRKFVDRWNKEFR